MERFDLNNSAYITKANKAIIHLGSRNAQRELKWHFVKNFIPHFWATNPNGQMLDHFRRKIIEVTTEHPMEVRHERKKYDNTCEADILFPWRYLFDRKIKCGFGCEDGVLFPTEDLGIPPKLGLFDLEVESPPEIMAKPENPIYPIVSFQFSENYTRDITLFMWKTKLPGWQKVEIPDYFLGCERAITLPVTFTHHGKKETVHPIVYLYDEEPKMVWDTIQWFDHQHFDASGGYFSNIFDWPYWIRRAKHVLNIPVLRLSPFRKVRSQKPKLPEHLKKHYRQKRRFSTYIKGMQVIDVAEMYKKWAGGRQPIVKGRPYGTTFDFHKVMEHECDFHYVDLGDAVHNSRVNRPVDWLEYCVGDAYALRILEEEKGIIRFFDSLRRIVGCPLEWAIHNSRLIDTRLLRSRERPLPTRRPQETQRVKGAIVFLPDIGIHENVAYIDEKSLYPMIIVVYNLGSDTLVLNPKDWLADDIIIGPMEDGTVLHFRSKPQSLLSKCVEYDMAEREKYRAQIRGMSITNPKYELLKMYETLHKFLACSYYGVLGFENFRLANDFVRKALTYLGRKHLEQCRDDLKREGYHTRYGDTDSLFVQLHGRLMEEGRIVEKIVNRTLNRIARRFGATYFIEAKYEHFCKRIIFVPKITKRKGKIVAAKKRYGFIDEHDQLYVVGMAPRSSSTPAIVRSTMLEWLELVLRHKNVTGAIKLVHSLWNNLPDVPFTEFAIPRGVHKEKYEHSDPWKDGCDFMNKHYGIVFREDKRPMLIYMRADQVGIKAICITEGMDKLPGDLEKWIDWETMREKIIKNKFKTLFTAIGVKFTDVITAAQEKALAERGPTIVRKTPKKIRKKRSEQYDFVGKQTIITTKKDRRATQRMKKKEKKKERDKKAKAEGKEEPKQSGLKGFN